MRGGGVAPIQHAQVLAAHVDIGPVQVLVLEPELTIGERARRSHCPGSTVHRLVVNLVRLGFQSTRRFCTCSRRINPQSPDGFGQYSATVPNSIHIDLLSENAQ